MKRKMISLMVAIMFVGTAFGQIIVTNEDYNHNRSTENPTTFGVMVPMQGQNVDQWKIAPLDGGLLLLAGFGAAYLVGKRKKNK